MNRIVKSADTMMKITKEQAAIMQLCDAIKMFKDERCISSITLSGASEEVLAQLLRQHSVRTGTSYFTEEELEAGMFDMFKDFLGVKNHHAYRNKIKNELKHHGDEKNKDILIGDFRQVALNHIAGSVQNYKMIHNYLPKEKVIEDFCLEIGIS